MPSIRIVFALAVSGFFLLTACRDGNESVNDSSDSSLSVRFGSEGEFPKVEFENALYRAVIRRHDGAVCGVEHAIRDWILKSSGQDQVNNYIDACAQRGPLKSAAIVLQSPDSIRFRLEFRDCDDVSLPFISEYTLYASSPVIRIDYLKYTYWTNSVDIGTPGGIGERHRAQTRVYGKENYIRALDYHEASFWNTFDPEYKDDPKDGGSLNYRGHLIMAVADPETGVGFGRVMPVRMEGKGGIKILKLLWDLGFETFAATGDPESERLPFTGYIYLFESGLDDAMALGKRIVDGAVR